MTSTSVRPSGFKQPSRDPGLAALLSIIPGLGQIYNGEKRKGILFLAVAMMNFTLFIGMCFTKPILGTLWGFGEAFHMKPNKILVRVLQEGSIGSAVSIVLIGFFIAFIAYAIRDAYDHAAMRRRQLYPDMVIELPEATSGSYIFHFSCMVALFILAFFFIVPGPPKMQVTDIEFIQNQPPTQKKIISHRRADKNSEASGKHNPTKPRVAPSPAPKAAAKAEAPAKPAPTPSPSPRPMPTPTARPTPSPSPSPSPQPKAAPMPSWMPKLPSPVPMPNAAPAPNMPRNTAAPMPTLAPTSLPRPAAGIATPTPMARPSGTPSPFAGATPAPVAIATGGAPGPAPVAKAGSSPFGNMFSAPAPVAVGGGGGGGSHGAPSPVPVASAGGGGSRTSSSGGGGAPAPTRGTTGGGGGRSGGGSGPALAVAPSVPRAGGGGGGEGQQGNPDPNGNPNGRPSQAAQADVDFGPYMADLQRRIKRHWFPPKGNESKRVVVVFKVHSGGELSHLRLDKSSGVAIADKAALDAVQNAAPFRPLPPGAPPDVDIQFTFDYNVFSGGGKGVFRQF